MMMSRKAPLYAACRLLLPLFLALLLVRPQPVTAHNEEPLPAFAPSAALPGPGQGAAVELNEQLGARIPLDLVFRDENGAAVRLSELVTGPTIILPVYYGCTNVCNYLQGGLARVLPALKARPGSDYRVISVSFDETESPQQATRAKRLHLAAIKGSFPEEGWRFLTGDAASIGRLTAAAGYTVRRQGRDFIHPVASLVVAGDGTIVRYLYGTTFLAKDVSLALIEARTGLVGSSIRKAVEYCFSFDPVGKTYVFNLLRVSATVVILCTGGFLAFLIISGKKRKQRDAEHS